MEALSMRFDGFAERRGKFTHEDSDKDRNILNAFLNGGTRLERRSAVEEVIAALVFLYQLLPDRDWWRQSFLHRLEYFWRCLSVQSPSPAGRARAWLAIRGALARFHPRNSVEPCASSKRPTWRDIAPV